MISINPSGTIGLCSSSFLPANVTAKFPKMAKAFSDECFTSDSFTRISTAPEEMNAAALSKTEDRLYSVLKHDSLVLRLLEFESRIETTIAMILVEVREIWLLARVDIGKRSCANSCFCASSKKQLFSGNFDKSPASTIRALFLKQEQKS